MSTTTLRSAVTRTPQTTAVVFDKEEVSYADLHRRANQLAHYLQAMGVGPDVLVGVLLERSLETIVTLLAIFKAGGAYVPLDPEYPDERLRFMMRDAGLEFVVTQAKLTSRLGDTVVQSIRVDADWAEIANESQDNPPLLASASNLAYIIYTSGSTGTPKGAMVTRGGMLNCLQWMQQRYELTKQDAFLMHTSLNFDSSVWEVFWPLLAGVRLVIAPADMLESSALLRYMAEQSVSCAFFVPSQLGMLVQEPGLSEMTSLRYVITGGEKLPLGVMREFQELSRAELHNAYGPTETAIAATEWTCEAGAERVLIGRPIGNTQVYVLNEQMEPLPVGVEGELYIGGAGVGRGYAGQAELTAERFVPHPFSSKPGARLYRTGDLVRYDAAGQLEFVDRVDQQVKVRGSRIELGEIEAVLRRHAQVSEAVVVLNEADGDKRLVAYVVSEVEAHELREYLKARLPDYMVPSFFVALNDLPLLPNGKLNRRALPALESMVLAETEYVAPRTATEELLAGLWARVLRVNRVGINDNFFALGGHSLLATQVIARVRDAFGQEVALRSLFEQPTVAGLAREIEAGRGLGAELQAPPLERVERAERLPLSFAQQRLWFLDQLAPGSSFYNIPAAVRLRGVLNVTALERTLSEVVRRHEALRTHFMAEDGEPVQVIEAAAPLPLEVLELSALEEKAREAEVLRLAQLEASQPFDLWRGPLLRVGLLRLGKEEHVALVTMHHIVSDGWSIGVFINEVATLYAAYVRGEESPLEELPIQYADFAHWQRGWLQGEVLAAQLAYWRAELADAPTVIDLPSDKPRPPIQTYRGAYQPLQLSAALSAQLRDLSRQNGSTLFMTLLAAFDLLLSRYTGQEQVLVGTPIANRNRSETEGLIGFFVNTLVLRGDVRGNPSFSELLRRVRETALSAYGHQDLPFEKLVEELQPERDMSRSPLFQVMFALQNAPAEALALPGLTLSSISTGSSAAKFDLGLTLQEIEGCITGDMDYNVDLFERTTIERLSEHYKTLLQSMVANFERPVAEHRLLSEAEERQLLYEWNEQPAGFDADLFIHELFAAQAAQHPEAVAVVFENQRLTYEELNGRANQLAHHLQGLGVGPEVVVGICIERSVEMVVALLGVLKAGAAYLPLDPAYPAERLSFMIADAGVRLVISHQAVAAMLPDSTINVLSLDAEGGTVAAQPATETDVSVLPDNLAYVLYTSGSTGQPKGVMISHGAISNHMRWMQEQFPLGASDAVLQKTPFSFDASVWEFWAPLLAGARLVMAQPGGHQEAQYLVEVMEREGVTRLQGVPTLLRLLVKEGGLERCTQLREVFSGGEVLGRELAASILRAHREVQLYNLYGPTEATIDTTWDEAERERVYAGEEVGIGQPISNAQVYVLDARMQLAPVGVVGELHIGGAGLAGGYLNRPTLTAERFVPHPYSAEPGAHLYRTGDMVRWLESGKLAYVGRVDAQVKLRGFRIELGEIEAALAEHEAVRECTVVAAADANGDTKLLAYLVAGRQQPAPSVTALREFLKEKLPEYMIPASFTMLDAMPLTPNGKIDRRALPAPDQARPEMGQEFIAPRNPAEQIVAGIWEELLDVRPIGVRDDFFSLGGHSLLAVRLMARIQASFGQHLPLASLFQGATIEKLASLLHEQPHDHGASPLVAIQPNGDGLPFFCIHPGGGNVLCYNELSNHLGFERPFYGLQARGLDENQIPHARIEDMAAYYIDAIRTVRPDGPYLLGGWSMGGVVAYEMAQQLEGQGQQVSLLALMDARPVTSVAEAARWDELTLLTNFARDLGLPVDGLQLSTDELAKLDPDELLSHVLQRAIEAGVVPGDIQLAQARRLFEVFKINVQAMQSYRPAASSTRVTLLRARDQEVADETMGWGALTSGEIELHRVPGDHFTIVREPYVRSLAEQLADCINRATLRSLASHT